MLRLPLTFVFMATCFLCTCAKEDIVQDGVAILTDGVALLKDVTNHMMASVKNIEETMKQFEKRMSNITELNKGIGLDMTELTPYKSFVKYDGEKKSLRLAESKLRPLMNKTITARDKLLDKLNRWNNRMKNGDGKTYLKQQVWTDRKQCLY